MAGALLLIGALACAAVADARNHQSGRRGSGGEAQEDDTAEGRMEIRASGLTPVFASDAGCAPIASPFAARTRYDGSRRPLDRFGGMHGGIDVSLREGTPLLAIADGKVIAVGTGGMFTGNYLWLQHAPHDTGLPFWVYAKYQHFRELPPVTVGQMVTVGQVIGMSGNTGTAGKHYGMSGYPHLHLTTFAGGTERYEVRDTSVVAAGARIIDPVAIYLTGLRDMAAIDTLPADHKTVTIPYVAEDGTTHPQSSRVVWPVRCTKK